MLAAVLGTADLAAQNPPPAPPPVPVPAAPQDSARPHPADSLRPRRDSVALAGGPARRDTILPDSLSPDSFRAALPLLGPPPGPLSRRARIVFDEDSLHYLGALTLGELLVRVPGVFLVRAGWFGEPEVIAYAGQGAASIEVYWDGWAMDPMGEDSSAIDVGRVSLGLVRRVEVEVLPSVLRVYLFSDVQGVRRARTETSFSTGDAQTNTYRIRYLNRWKDGTGLGVGVNWFGTNGPSTAASDVTHLSIWLKGTWSPSPLVGVEYQVLRQNVSRDPLTVTTSGAQLPRVDVRRTDGFVRAYAATRPDGLGLRLDALLGSASYRDSSAGTKQSLSQGAAVVAYRATRWSAEATTRIRDARTPLDLQLRGSWVPMGSLTLSAYALRRTHLGDRRSVEAGGTAEFHFLRALVFRGGLRWRDAVASPAMLADTNQSEVDWSAGGGIHLARLDLDVDLTRHDNFSAPAFGVFTTQLPAGSYLLVRTVTAALSARLTRSLTLSGWYRHPLDPLTAAFEPPHHTRAALTLRSKFLPTFRRGIFDLVAQMGVEGWSDGVAGTDSSGTDIQLKGAVTVDYLFEIRLVGAVLFWTMRNAQLERYGEVPGFEMPRGLQRFGVRWEFTN